MNELKKIVQDTSQKLGVAFTYYEEKKKPTGVPVCEKAFENVTDDGDYTFFRFLFKGTGYIGAIAGVGETQRNYALLLPAYIEAFADKETELSKTDWTAVTETTQADSIPSDSVKIISELYEMGYRIFVKCGDEIIFDNTEKAEKQYLEIAEYWTDHLESCKKRFKTFGQLFTPSVSSTQLSKYS